MMMEDVTIGRVYIFIGHGDVRQAGAGWTSSHRLRSHADVLLTGETLQDPIAFPYQFSLQREGNGTYGTVKYTDSKHSNSNCEGEKAGGKEDGRGRNKRNDPGDGLLECTCYKELVDLVWEQVSRD